MGSRTYSEVPTVLHSLTVSQLESQVEASAWTQRTSQFVQSVGKVHHVNMKQTGA